MERLASERKSHLLRAVGLKLRRRASALMGRPGRFVFHSDTLAGKGPESIVRTYLDHLGLRTVLTEVLGDRRLDKAADLGCGYGRMSLVLKEFATEVWGFEREPHLVSIGQRLIDGVHFQRVESLAEAAVEDGHARLEMAAKTTSGKRSQADLGHEVERTATHRQSLADEAYVDLGLAASRHAVKEHGLKALLAHGG